MKTVNLTKESPSVGELLDMARDKSVLLVSKNGETFVLEEADDFDREVAELGNSENFMRFLKQRAKERGVTSIEQFAQELTRKTRKTSTQPTRSAGKPRRVPAARKRRSPARG